MQRKKETDSLIEEKCFFVINQLKSLREEKGYSTYKLSELTGIAQSNLTRMETMKVKPNLETVMKICVALDVNLEIV